MKDPKLEAYLDHVEREFFRIKGRPGTLSPADFNLASEWYHDEIPIGAVLEGIADAFEAREASRDGGIEEVNSLRFCESFIAAAISRRRGSPG